MLMAVRIVSAVIVGGGFLGAGIAAASGSLQPPKDGTAVQIANPAAVFCIKSGGTHVIRKAVPRRYLPQANQN